jgi:hypothetical protein
MYYVTLWRVPVNVVVVGTQQRTLCFVHIVP